MAEVIKMPKMSDTMTEGVIVSWLKKVGDQVKSGDILAEIETDKATMELESYEDGILLYIGAKEKEKVPIGGILAVIGKKGEDFKSLIASASDKSKTSEEQLQTIDLSQNIKKEDEYNNTQKQAAENAEINKNIQGNEQNNIDFQRIKASPLAKKVAEQMGYDISKIQGTGDRGRIIRKDVEAASQANKSESKMSKNISYNQPAFEESFEDISVSSMRATIGKKLTESLANAPHFYLTSEINMSKVVQMREIINGDFSNNISFNDIILKAVSIALRRFPDANISWLGDKIRRNNHIHIGIAVAIEEGLVVPVLRFIDTKTLSQISNEVKEFIIKSKEKKLSIEEMQGSTFCISNLGMFGIDSFTSIINPPSACILAIGGIKKKPIVNENDELVVGNIMKVTLSCDHRAIDGAVGASFLAILKDILEEPISMLL